MKQPESMEPLVIEGTIGYKFTLDVDNDKIGIEWETSIGNDLAAILIARELSARVKSDIEQFKKKGLIPKADKEKINKRLDKVTNSIMSLGIISNDMIAAVLQMSISQQGKGGDNG